MGGKCAALRGVVFLFMDPKGSADRKFMRAVYL
jgi:hypothetical protein